MDDGDIIRSIRKALQMDQVEFGNLFNKGPSWTTKLERGHNEGFLQFLEVARKMVLEMGVDPLYLLTGKGEMFVDTKDTKKETTTNPETDSLLARIAKLEETVFGEAK